MIPSLCQRSGGVMPCSEKELCLNSSKDDKGWLSAVDATRWLEHVALLLQCTQKIVNSLEEGVSVFTHCSDGWDRTSQLTGLSMLCLDPYYRTLDGFAVLIQKEWLAIGHKFAQRYGHGDKHYDDKDRSPIFPQFLDGVWQIMQQFPTSFEFNQHLLITILDAVYSCQFGTFLFNTERERKVAKLTENTISLWTWVEKHRVQFLSRSYAEEVNWGKRVLMIVPGVKHLKLWNTYYLRYTQFYDYDARLEEALPSVEPEIEEALVSSWVWYQQDTGGPLPSLLAPKKQQQQQPQQQLQQDTSKPPVATTKTPSDKNTIRKKKDGFISRGPKKVTKKKRDPTKSNSERMENSDEDAASLDSSGGGTNILAVSDTSFLVVNLRERLREREREAEKLRESVEKLQAKVRRRSKELKSTKQQLDNQIDSYLEMKQLLSLQRKKERWLKGRIMDRFQVASPILSDKSAATELRLGMNAEEAEALFAQFDSEWDSRIAADYGSDQMNEWQNHLNKEPDELAELEALQASQQQTSLQQPSTLRSPPPRPPRTRAVALLDSSDDNNSLNHSSSNGSPILRTSDPQQQQQQQEPSAKNPSPPRTPVVLVTSALSKCEGTLLTPKSMETPGN
eukprot:TRINITY_DN7582_c0_g1_i1.p1 TRINITY_DN7582_c0_g1~~TRINITY_DN7582_c0_g1_i1.p1  ORF type:complete len:621 (-),score=159.07 TRINITY_DN7582_c0_g1_i1:89-1951(-)